jgi:hypothetical protein
MVRYRASCIGETGHGKPVTCVGLDVHKDTKAVALAEVGLRGEVREHGKIPNTPAALKALTVKLAPESRELRFCYEAGPCWYGILWCWKIVSRPSRAELGDITRFTNPRQLMAYFGPRAV